MNEQSYGDRIIAAATKKRESMDTAGSYLTDSQASTVVDMYPLLQDDGSLVKVGTRIQWQGKLMRAANDLWDRKENWPDVAPSLWEEINYHEGVRVIPDVITVGLAFAKDELGWWHKDGKVYKSKIAANVYTPEEYADGWEIVNK